MSALAIAPTVVEATIDLTLDEARDLTDRIVFHALDLVALVQQAYLGRAWVPLGYRSWEEYLEQEIGTALAGLPREQRRGTVGVLADAGMSTHAIKATLGLGSDQTVRADLKLVRPDGVGPVVGRDGKTYTKAPAAIEVAPKKPVVKTATALELLEQVGPEGLTIPELMKKKRWTYGQASATFSRLHAQRTKDGGRRVERLDVWRGEYSVYCAPEHVGDRALLAPKQRRGVRA